MSRKVSAFTVIVFLAISICGWTVGAAKADECSAAQGQLYIDQGLYEEAIEEFTCVIDGDPTGVEGYRGRIEAQLLLGRFSDAVRDYSRVNAYVAPVHPDAYAVIKDGYAERLADDPQSVNALTGLSFAHWWFFAYPQAIHTLNDLLAVEPDNVYANLFRGSSRLLKGLTWKKGIEDLERALTLEPGSADVRYIIADAYTYGKVHDPQRAFDEASLALAWGLDTPRIHAILAGAYTAFGDVLQAATHIQIHIGMVTTELIVTDPLAAGDGFGLDFAPGRVYEIPIAATAGEPVEITTSARIIWDSIMVLLDEDGNPVVGSDDDCGYMACFEWTPAVSGTYRLQVTTFEAVSTGQMTVSRD